MQLKKIQTCYPYSTYDHLMNKQEMFFKNDTNETYTIEIPEDTKSYKENTSMGKICCP